MLKVFRDNLKRLAPVLWLVIAVFVLLVFADFRDTGQAGSPNATAATVDGRNITFGEFQRQYRNVEDRWRQIYGDSYTTDLANQLGLPMQAMNDLVAQQILLREADEMGLEATRPEMQRVILDLPVFQDEKGNFVGQDQYERILQQNRLEVDVFEADIRDQVVLQKLNRLLARNAWVGDAELEAEARKSAETATLRYLALDPAAIPEQPELNDEEVVAYFDQRREQYRLPERRKIGYLSINANTIRAELTVSDQELRDYYAQNVEEFTQQEQVRAQHILLFVTAERSAEEVQKTLETAKARIEGGADFAVVARELSEDEATKERGGDLGFFPRGRMTPAFEQAAFSAAEGALVGPIENQLGPRTGYHLIKINAKQPGGQQPFEQVENRIRVRLLNDRSREAAESQARALYERIQDETVGSEEALRTLAAREGVAVEVTDFIAADENIPGIGRQTAFAASAFQQAPGRLSEPTRVAAGWALIDVIAVEPPALPELDQVRERVLADAARDKKARLAVENLARGREQIEAGPKTLEQIAESYDSSLVTTPSLTAESSISGLADSRAVVDLALDLEQGDLGGPLQVGDRAVLFEVMERSHFDPVSFAANKEQTREQMRIDRVNSLLQSLINHRRDQLDVTYSREFLANFNLDAGAQEGV